MQFRRVSCCIIRQGIRRFSAEPSPLVVERLDGTRKGIVLFRLNRPSTKNAISKLLASQLQEGIAALKHCREARVLILKSDVKGTFCTGADLKERKTMPVEDVPAFVEGLRGIADGIARLPIPTIAAIDGFAFGGGLEFALACDMRVANVQAKLGLTETRLAIIPGAGGTQRLSRLVGPARAKELIFTGRILDGKEAARLGIVNDAVDGGEDAAFQKALLIAEEILPRGPIAVRMAKMAIDAGLNSDMDTGLQMEKACTAILTTTKDRIEGLAAFNEKRPPLYKGE